MELGTRALSAGEVLDTAFDLVRQNAVLLVGLAALIYLPIALLTAGIDPKQAQLDPSSVLTRGLPAILYGLLVAPIVSIALIAVLGALARGRSTGFAAALRSGVVLLVPFAWASLLVLGILLLALVPVAVVALLWTRLPGLVRAAGVASGFVLPLLVALRFLLLGQVVVIEQARGAGALRRSAELLRGRALRCFGILMLGGLLTGLLGMGVQLALGWLPVAGGLLVGLAQAVGVAYTSALGVVLYFDACAREHAAGAAPIAAPPASA
jgi:hypothetical protein